MHTPVLLDEVINFLDPKPNENFVDCTVGQGGHAAVILEKIKPNGKVLGIDLDKGKMTGIENNRLVLVNGNYANLKDILKNNNFGQVNGILVDLGFSSEQLEGRGLSFSKNENLDMRYGEGDLTAEKIVNNWSEEQIRKVLEEYGEEKFALQIAKAIVEQRTLRFRSVQAQVKTTFDLVEIIKKAVPEKFRYGKIHCATRTFQALRIAVNGELENLKKVLPQAVSVLQNGGRLAIISFHSLEDRIVKNFFKDSEKQNLIKILTKKPIEASDQEIADNPRSRSAKLRAIEKL